jgi:hypothetical protein
MRLSYEYIAGLFDGDGCVSCSLIQQRSAAGKLYGKTLMMPHVGIFNQNLEVLLEVMNTMECGEVLACVGNRKKGNTGAYRWDLNKTDIRLALDKLLPYLRVKREQAQVMLLLLDTTKGKANGNRPLTPEVIQQRQLLVAKLGELNHADSKAYREKWVNSGNLSKSCRLVARYETILSQAEVPIVSSEGAETRLVPGKNNPAHERPLPKGNDIVRSIQ